MPSLHSIRAGVLAVAATVPLAVGATPPEQAAADQASPTSSNFTVFAGSVAVGSESVSVERTPEGWTISSSGRIGAPFDIDTRLMRVRYAADWKPLELTIDATARGQSTSLRMTVSGTTASSEIDIGGALTTRTDTINEAALLLPSPFFSSYEALSARLRTASAGTTMSVFVPHQAPMVLTVVDSSAEQIQTLARVIQARRTRVKLNPPPSMPTGMIPVEADVWGDEEGRLLRVSVPAQSLVVVREDIASVSTRIVAVSRAGDEQVRIPANGFSLTGTISKPTGGEGGARPAVVLVGGSDGPTDRDETLSGIPVFGQLAGVLADAGLLVLRYDKRGTGQSGGRPESATLADYAEDLRAAVRMMSDRRDVDRRRLAVVGHGEGGFVAMIAASRENRIRALVLVAAIGTTGVDHNLALVTRALERSDRPEAEKQTTMELQRKIHTAVLTGSGWEDVPAEVRRQADVPLFQSFLAFDPAKLMPDIDQPLLVLHGLLDREVPPLNADRLDALARARRRTPPVEVVRLPDINHLLVPATTGDVGEYATLKDRQVSPEVGRAIAEWLQKTLAAAR